MILSTPKTWFTTSPRAVVADQSLKAVALRNNNAAQCNQGPEGTIRDMFDKVDLSVSSYDTAWMAMVPSPNSPLQPYFPQCLNWLIENQLPDGSWGLPGSNPLLIKDSLMSTLACMLALRKWEDGELHVRKGLEFLESNFEAVMDKKQKSPIGFDIIFSGMVRQAKDLDLNLRVSKTSVDAMLHKRDFEFQRVSRSHSDGEKAYLAYIAEGLMDLQDWKEIMKYQRKNGSLFNSPSTTAATLIHFHDAKCLDYLNSILEKFGSAVPTTYPTDMHIRLSIVDHLESLGIHRHFKDEIKSVLNETYRCWLQMDEDIFLDTQTRALAFRLLRTNGYDISSDVLAEFGEEEHFFNSLDGRLKGMTTVLELYKASEIKILPSEPVLEKLHSWTSNFLQQQLLNGTIDDDKIYKQVDCALKYNYDLKVGRLENRRYIECYDVDNVQMLKTSYRCLNVDKRDILQFSVEDYNFCQAIYQKELEYLETWVKEHRLDQVRCARQRMPYIYLCAACMCYPPELSDARMSWAKNIFLVTVVDDFYDAGWNREDQLNLIELMENWDGNSSSSWCSEDVEIIFSAVRNTVNEFTEIAFKTQGRSVRRHLIDIWLNLCKCMMSEAEWGRNSTPPTMDEYIEISSITITFVPIIQTTLYVLGPKLSEDIIASEEFNNLFKHTNICGRLENDIVTVQRESQEGKFNSVMLHMIHSSVTEQEAVKEINKVVELHKRELLRLVLQTDGSVVPKPCKDIFWKTSRLGHLFWNRIDEFTSPDEMVTAVKKVIHQPLSF